MAQDTQSQLNAAIAAARTGDRATARRLLQAVIVKDRNNETAWIWLAATASTAEDKRKCLERVLEINPANKTAQEALRQLGAEPPAPKAKNTPAQSSSEGSSPFVLPAIIVGVVISLGVLGYIIYSIIAPNTPQLTGNEIAQAVTQTAIARIPTATSFLRPSDTPEPTFAGVIVTPGSLPTLPPTFTPTPTATATVTDTPTATPPPLDTYRMIYRSQGIGEEEPSLVLARADGSGENRLGVTLDNGAISPDGQRVAFVRVVAEIPILPTATQVPTEAPTLTPTVELPPTLEGEEPVPTPDIPPTEAGLNETVFRILGDQDEAAVETQVITEIFVAPLNDITAAVQVSDFRGASLRSLAWTPDGERILFVQDDTTLASIPAGGGPVIEYIGDETGGIKSDPAVSPDGRYIAFASDADTPGFAEIFLHEVETGITERLTDDTGSSYSPAWSPDGMIAFISDRSGDADLYIVGLDGAAPRLVTFDDQSAEDRTPTWTPDGRWIAFSSNRGSDTFQIYLTNTEGTQIEQVTDTDRNELAPAFLQ